MTRDIVTRDIVPRDIAIVPRDIVPRDTISLVPVEPVQEVRHGTVGPTPHSPLDGYDHLTKEDKRVIKFDSIFRSECPDLGILNCSIYVSNFRLI